MKLFRIRGGVHPDDRKTRTAELAITDAPLPEVLHIPVQQHLGAPAQTVVEVGQALRKGDLIARAQGAVSAPIHAPTSGQVLAIGDYPANHPSGLPVRTVSLRPDGKDRWRDDLQPCADPFALAPAEVARRVGEAGIVGMGGATFPAAVKLNLGARYELTTLVINGAECEPFLTCDDRLMREHAEQVVDGVRIMAHALGVARAIIAIENNKPEAQTAIRSACAGHPGVAVAGLPTRYPMGSEKHLVQTLTGRETPARALTAELGVVVHNIATAYAVHQALRLGRPLVERTVTVSGGCVPEPANLRVLIGTPVEHLLAHCGAGEAEPARLIGGGPMMGQPLPHARVPIVKGSNGVLALSAEELAPRAEGACIRCGTCVQVCPCGLVPLEMAARVRADDLGGAMNLGLLDCVGCGSCAYACPSGVPLAHYFNYAKGALAARQREEQKLAETKRLAERRVARIEEQKRRKREALAKRKAEAAAAQAAESAATESSA
jgi:electron transport complex protein RnfC